MLGVMSLRRRYEPAWLEGCVRRACTTGAISYRSVKSILAAGLDQLPLEDCAAASAAGDACECRKRSDTTW